ncbi:MAG: response regulator [Verrucomicrobiota bacterium]
MRILYWDDSDTVLESVSRKLTKLQHKPVMARTIDDCKAALDDEENPVDLFIADHSIDEKNGMTFIMGAKAKDPDLHVVVLTPAILRSEFNQLDMCGINVMKKPILLDQVVRPYLSPDKRRKRPTQPPINIPEPPKGGTKGLLAAREEASKRPEGMPPPPGAPEEPKKKKGLTRLFSK